MAAQLTARIDGRQVKLTGDHAAAKGFAAKVVNGDPRALDRYVKRIERQQHARTWVRPHLRRPADGQAECSDRRAPRAPQRQDPVRKRGAVSVVDIPRTPEAYNRLLRGHFPFFLHAAYDELDQSEPLVWNWPLDAMCYAMDQVYQGQNRRLVITIPPRHLKTITCSIAFVAWVMGLDPTQKFICVSYNVDLAARFSRSFRQLVETEWYRLAFPDFQIARATDVSIETTTGGYRNATSVNGMVTGTGATYIVIDDISKGVDSNSPLARESVREFYRNSLVTRFNNPTMGRTIVIGQRLHKDDFPGYCLETGTYNIKFARYRADRRSNPYGSWQVRVAQDRRSSGPDTLSAVVSRPTRAGYGSSALLCPVSAGPCSGRQRLFHVGEGQALQLYARAS